MKPGLCACTRALARLATPFFHAASTARWSRIIKLSSASQRSRWPSLVRHLAMSEPTSSGPCCASHQRQPSTVAPRDRPPSVTPTRQPNVSPDCDSMAWLQLRSESAFRDDTCQTANIAACTHNHIAHLRTATQDVIAPADKFPRVTALHVARAHIPYSSAVPYDATLELLTANRQFRIGLKVRLYRIFTRALTGVLPVLTRVRAVAHSRPQGGCVLERGQLRR